MKKQVGHLALCKETLKDLQSPRMSNVVAGFGSGRYTFCGHCSAACPTAG